MKNFFKNNKLILIFMFATVVYTFCYITYSSKDDMFSTLYVISLSYIVAVIFYVLQVIVPETKRIASVNRVIKSRINSIIKCVNRLYDELCKLYVRTDNSDDEVIGKFDQIQSKFSMKDITSISNIGRIKSINEVGNKENLMTLKELLFNTINVLNDNIDFLYKTLPEYLSNELINTLEAIKESEFVKEFSFFLHMHPNMNLTIEIKDHNMFEDFWKLKEKLAQLVNEIHIKSVKNNQNNSYASRADVK